MRSYTTNLVTMVTTKDNLRNLFDKRKMLKIEFPTNNNKTKMTKIDKTKK